jgi:hypothetical protein
MKSGSTYQIISLTSNGTNTHINNQTIVSATFGSNNTTSWRISNDCTKVTAGSMIYKVVSGQL